VANDQSFKTVDMLFANDIIAKNKVKFDIFINQLSGQYVDPNLARDLQTHERKFRSLSEQYRHLCPRPMGAKTCSQSAINNPSISTTPPTQHCILYFANLFEDQTDIRLHILNHKHDQELTEKMLETLKVLLSQLRAAKAEYGYEFEFE
jgi:hypothetical protein